MKAIKVISAILTLCVTMPIWYYLLYKILIAINASELMWFLFWIYIPIGFICGIINKIAEKSEE